MNIGLVSLGCSKNRVDSENILGWFKANQHRIVTDLSKADLLVVNTCGFIEPAKKESIDTILEMSKFKEDRCQALVVTGCLVQRYKAELEPLLPEVDAWIQIKDYPKMDQILESLLDHPSKVVYGKQERLQTTLKHTAYLKIAEGCSNRCSYCAIPLIRGNMNSYAIDGLVEEARKLAQNGVKELVLIAQDTSRFGEEQGNNQLVELLERLHAIEGFEWIRMLYLYPNAITPELLAGMKRLPKVLPYFDIPIQHADNELLRRMNRKGTIADIRQAIDRIRAAYPDAVLRTTAIVGFPGETEAQFQTLLDFIQEVQFDRLGAFTYSPEEDTQAFDFPDSVSNEVKEDRLHRLMQAQEMISEGKMQAQVGKTFEVLIESRESKSLVYKGRSVHMAPDDVDGEVAFTSDSLLPIGQLVQVTIDEVSSFDMSGHLS